MTGRMEQSNGKEDRMVEHPNVGGDRSGRGKDRSGIAAILMVAQIGRAHV